MFRHRCFQNSDHGHGWKDRPSPTPCSSASNFHCIGLPLTPPMFFHGRLPHPSQGSVLGGVRFDNPNGIKHPYRIGIVPVAVAVPLVPVLAVIMIFLLAIFSPPLSFFVFGDGFCDMSIFCTRGYRDAVPAEIVVVGKPSSLGQSMRS